MLVLSLSPCLAVPTADNIDLQLSVVRLTINDYTTRYQIKLVLTAIADEPAGLSAIEAATLTIGNPAGQLVVLAPREKQHFPKTFKAARSVAVFSAIEDTADETLNTVPASFLSGTGPFSLHVQYAGVSYLGETGFGDAVGLSATQVGETVSNFSLAAESPLTLATTPQQFGPVYYKHQDRSNFAYQLANMDQALAGGDFHLERESPQFVFQLKVGDGQGGPTRLVPPERYIDGYQPHMIRSESTSTPLVFQPSEYQAGEVVVADFQRLVYPPPDSVFTGPDSNLTSYSEIVNRAIYVLYVEDPPSPEELGITDTQPIPPISGQE